MPCLKKNMLRDDVTTSAPSAVRASEDLSTILGRITTAFNKIETG